MDIGKSSAGSSQTTGPRPRPKLITNATMPPMTAAMLPTSRPAVSTRVEHAMLTCPMTPQGKWHVWSAQEGAGMGAREGAKGPLGTLTMLVSSS